MIGYFVNINFNNTLKNLIYLRSKLFSNELLFNLTKAWQVNPNILSNFNTTTILFLPSPAIKTYLFSFQARLLPSTSVHKFTVSIKASISPLEFPFPTLSYRHRSPTSSYVIGVIIIPHFTSTSTCLRNPNHRNGQNNRKWYSSKFNTPSNFTCV